MNKMRLLALSLVFLLCVSCGEDDNAEPPAELIAFKGEYPVNINWWFSTGAGISEQYVKLFQLLSDDRLVTADRDGTVTSVHAETGNELWQTDVDEILSGGVGGDRSVVLVASRSGELFAINGENGDLMWRKQVLGEVLSPPVIAANRIIARSVEGTLFALDIETGEQLWNYRRDVPVLSLRGTGMPVIYRGRIFAGLDNGRLVALSVIDGEVLWDVAISIPKGRSEIQRLVDLDGHAVVDQGVIYAVGYQGNIAALDTSSGQVIWSREMSSHSGVVVDENAVYLTDEFGHIWALDRSNGATLWKQDELTARQTTSPVIHENKLIVGDYEGYLHWLSKHDGRFVARHLSASSGILVPPVTYKQNVIVSDRGGVATSVYLGQHSVAKTNQESADW